VTGYKEKKAEIKCEYDNSIQKAKRKEKKNLISSK
jgi:hypothetical protein